MNLFRKKLVPNEKTSPVTLPNGKVIEMSNFDILDDGNCLVSDNDIYHYHVGCFLKWRPENRAAFTGWRLMPVKDAIKQGYSYCPYCFDQEN